MLETRIFSDRRCLEHRVPAGFPEVPARLSGVLASVEELGLEELTADDGPPAGLDEAVAGVHGRAYPERLRRAVERGDGLIDSADNPLSPATWTAARAAAGAAVAAAAWAAAGAGRLGFAAVRL
ncbi:MAG: hypothetical protein R3325_15885, partial [Thermoanaerobaculia bacterium]|nr:hypothetical protein [Thermoanaerobaculia bacterium]